MNLVTERFEEWIKTDSGRMVLSQFMNTELLYHVFLEGWDACNKVCEQKIKEVNHVRWDQ